MFWADQPDDGRICLLGLEGSLSRMDLADLAERLRGLAAQGVLRVVVDLRGVEHWEPQSLPVLAAAVQHRRAQGGVTAFILSDPILVDGAARAGVLDGLERYDELRLEPNRSPLPSRPRVWPLARAAGE